jgi:hypothetical protein
VVAAVPVRRPTWSAGDGVPAVPGRRPVTNRSSVPPGLSGPERRKAPCARLSRAQGVRAQSHQGDGVRASSGRPAGRTGPSRATATLRFVTLAIPALITLIGVSALFMRRQPVVPLVAIFFVLGMYAGQTWVGHQVTDGLVQLGRLIG